MTSKDLIELTFTKEGRGVFRAYTDNHTYAPHPDNTILPVVGDETWVCELATTTDVSPVLVDLVERVYGIGTIFNVTFQASRKYSGKWTAKQVHNDWNIFIEPHYAYNKRYVDRLFKANPGPHLMRAVKQLYQDEDEKRLVLAAFFIEFDIANE